MFTPLSPSRRLRPARRTGPVLLLSGLVSLGLAGCATGDIAMMATIAGGQQIQVPLSRGGVVWTNEGGVQIKTANFILSPEKKILYAFEFIDSQKRDLRSVRVEDVSDNAPVLMVEDLQPKILPTGQWRGEAAPLEFSDPKMSWVATIQNSIRVFRFTLTFADGHTQVLLQGTFYTANMKQALRQVFGEKY